MKPIEIVLKEIRVNGGTQPRAAMDNDAAQEYAEQMAEGAEFPPVDVFYDGKDYWLADGFHRVAAAIINKFKTIPARVHQGDVRDAILFSVGANLKHGLRYTNADKRRSVERVLKDDEWVGWSDRAIADKCGVDHKTVAAARARLASGEIPHPKRDPEAKNGDSGKKPETGALGGLDRDDAGESIDGLVVSETNTRKPDESKKEESGADVQDEVGQPITSEAVALVFADLPRFRSLATKIATLKDDAQELIKLPCGAWVARNEQQFNADVTNFRSIITFCAPYAVCPFCGGEKCRKCSQVGWFPKEAYLRAVPENMRKEKTDATA